MFILFGSYCMKDYPCAPCLRFRRSPAALLKAEVEALVG
jgi:hypothetical protein